MYNKKWFLLRAVKLLRKVCFKLGCKEIEHKELIYEVTPRVWTRDNRGSNHISGLDIREFGGSLGNDPSDKDHMTWRGLGRERSRKTTVTYRFTMQLWQEVMEPRDTCNIKKNENSRLPGSFLTWKLLIGQSAHTLGEQLFLRSCLICFSKFSDFFGMKPLALRSLHKGVLSLGDNKHQGLHLALGDILAFHSISP